MKKTKNINRFLAGAALIGMLFLLNSCLKNGQYATAFAAAKPSVDLPLSAANNNAVVTFAYNATVTSIDFPFYIDLASPKTLGTAVTATFALDTAFLNSYNTTNSTNYQLLPDSVYTVINGWNRTIPAGERLDSMYVHIDFTKMDLSMSYVLPITIQNASVPIEQWNHLMINPAVKNQYDGYYDLHMSTVGWGAYGIADGGSYDWGQIGFVTSGASSNIFDIGAQPAFTTGGASQTSFGATNPQFTFDPVSNNLVSVTNLKPDDGRGRAFAINPAVTTSRYDPSTQTIYAAYLMYQLTRPTQYIYDTLYYLGPR